MYRILVVLAASSIAMAPSPFQGQQLDTKIATSGNAVISTNALPPIPKGKSTVIGGEIRNFDPVRDQFMLNVFGGGPHLKILFDERTQVYRNGQRISVLQLHPEDHASVETTLDGTKVFALKIHILSDLPEGECRGQVVSYNPQNEELTINEKLSQQPITLRVPSGTPVTRIGQKTFAGQQVGQADLGRGALVEVKFISVKGHGVATGINVLAVPGSAFVFSGSLSSFDMRAGRMVIADPDNDQSYEVSFDPSRFPASSKLHEGSHVKVTTNFDGTQYVASNIMIE